MNTLLRTYLAISLALMLALTGQSMALARGATGPAGQMVLCTGTGPVSIYVDENGRPTPPPAFCPDCALHLLASVAPPPGVPTLLSVARPVSPLFQSDPVEGARARSHAMARAPPRLI